MVGLSLVLLAAGASANGQVSHSWVSRTAREHLPAGELKEILDDPRHEEILVNATMFPDGGYAVDDDYGELAHWETLQEPYLAWIKANYEPPWTDEATAHITFLMGMASHGMADQVYDSLFIERARVYDAESDWNLHSADSATDIAFAAATGVLYTAPEAAYPADPLLDLLVDIGHPVDEATVDRGMSLVGVALNAASLAGSNADQLHVVEDWFPWATTHQLEPLTGAPPCEAEVVALYWQALWERLHDRTPASPILWTLPHDGALAHPIEADRVESRVSVVFRRGLSQDNLTTADFLVQDETGAGVDVDVQLYYRETSHVVHLIPATDWTSDMDYTVTVKAGAQTWDGETLPGEATFHFSTRLPAGPSDADPEAGCGCATSGSGAGLGAFGLLVGALVRRRRVAVASGLLLAGNAMAQEGIQSGAYKPAPVAGHPVFDMRVGVDRMDMSHPYICGEISPLGWLSLEGCGTGNGFLHHGDEPDMAHFRTRIKTVGIDKGRAEADLLVGVGFAEVQNTADQPGFKFGKAQEERQVEAAGPEVSAAIKSRMWLDNGGRTYVSGDLSAGAALIPAAPEVIGHGGPVVPFAALTVGLGF